MSEQKREWWTAQDLAKAAGINDSYIRRLLIAGKLDGEKIGRQWLIRDQVARAFLLKRAEQKELDL